MPKGYRYTLEMIDDRTQQAMATCDLIGRPAFSALTIMDEKQRAWGMSPNRKIMPSRWIVTDPQQRIAMQFDQKILGKLVNPLYKVAFSLLDGEGKEVYRLVDPRTDIPDRLFGVGPNEWAVIAGDRPAAKLVRLSRQKQPSPGFIGALKALLTASDPGIVSLGRHHVLPAPVALGMLVIFNELINEPGG